MRFFTRAWHGGEMPDAEAERIASMYEAHLAALGPRLPSDARRLWTEVSLHDGLLRAVERAANRFEVFFRAGENSTGYFDARLSYNDVSLSPSDEQFLRNAVGRRDVELLSTSSTRPTCIGCTGSCSGRTTKCPFTSEHSRLR